jgi:hypothetical protein
MRRRRRERRHIPEHAHASTALQVRRDDGASSSTSIRSSVISCVSRLRDLSRIFPQSAAPFQALPTRALPLTVDTTEQVPGVGGGLLPTEHRPHVRDTTQIPWLASSKTHSRARGGRVGAAEWCAPNRARPAHLRTIMSSTEEPRRNPVAGGTAKTRSRKREVRPACDDELCMNYTM